MQNQQGALRGLDRIQAEMLGMLGEPVAGQRWVQGRQLKIWRPPTDVYETDEYVIVKVEIAGMTEEDFAISLEGKRLIVSGVRRDPGAKLAYHQLEILYGLFETAVHLTRAIQEDKIEATYHNGFLSVRLPKVRPRQVPVVSAEDAP
jgi:HSP20 family molecular chaperone IbpA